MCHSLSPSARWSCHSMASSGTTFPDNCAYTDFRATRWRRVHDLPATRWQRVAHAGDNARVYTNWLEWPLGAILGHLCTLLGCCAVVDRRGDAIVYTNRRKWPISAVLGHLCTLLRLARIVRATVGTQECTQMGGSGLSAPLWGVCVHCCDTSRNTNRDASCVRWHECLNRHGVLAAPPRWPLPLGREDRLCASGAAARLASSPRRQPTRTPEEHKKNGPTHYGVGPRTSLVDRQGFEPWTLGLRVWVRIPVTSIYLRPCISGNSI